jgi:hypothetical protein
LTADPINTNAETEASAIRGDGQVTHPHCVTQALLRGAIGFGIVSLAAFSVWAFGGKWFQTHLGEAGLYSACAFVFLTTSGFLLHSLVHGPGAFVRFYSIFIPAFLAYAIIWCVVWFLLRFGLGEWVGSLLGTSAFVAAAGWRFRNYHSSLKAILILFGFHSVGYFIGGKLMQWVAGPNGSTLLTGLSRHQIGVVAKLSWGLCYGAGFGAGIGYVFHILQAERKTVPIASGGPADRGL